MAILTHLPNLRDLNIIGPACGFSEGELAQLRHSGPAIRSLRVNADNTGSMTPMAVTSWPAVLQLIAAIPTLRMLDVISNYVDQLPSFTPPLQLQLVSFKLNTQWPTDATQFVASLSAGPLELFYQTGWAGFDLVGIGSAHLRSLSLEEPSTAAKQQRYLDLLGRCTQLDRIECRGFPSSALLAAIPRTITALSVVQAYTTPYPSVLQHLVAQLDTFPRLRVFSSVASTPGTPLDPNVDVLRQRCEELGIEFRRREFGSLSDDEVQFSLRRRLLVF
ncbi:hypothetical protein C8R46DRAFT_426347 [Mycena filopes]|nr:hypothetical protein C8R46DRAFT_426347 [Mycena filopes]